MIVGSSCLFMLFSGYPYIPKRMSIVHVLQFVLSVRYSRNYATMPKHTGCGRSYLNWFSVCEPPGSILSWCLNDFYLMICEMVSKCKGIVFRNVNCDISHDFKAKTKNQVRAWNHWFSIVTVKLVSPWSSLVSCIIQVQAGGEAGPKPT